MYQTRTDPLSRAGTREALVALPSVSVIVPAFDEERCIAETLDHLRAAAELLMAHTGRAVQILLVDNASTDGTAAIAHDRGVTVIDEAEHNIAKVRNTGARAADHDVLVFVDADTRVPSQSLLRIGQVMALLLAPSRRGAETRAADLFHPRSPGLVIGSEIRNVASLAHAGDDESRRHVGASPPQVSMGRVV